jgi:hypothetical protein
MGRQRDGQGRAVTTKSFTIPGHELLVPGHEGAWLVTVDRTPRLPSGYATLAEAWVAGVREAERLEKAGREATEPTEWSGVVTSPPRRVPPTEHVGPCRRSVWC